MAVKKADLKYISDETEKYLGRKFVFEPGEFGSVSTKENIRVFCTYTTDFKKWIDSMKTGAFTTWDNGVEINLDKEPPTEKQVINFLKERPVSAALETPMFVFEIHNVPRTMSHQLVRHRFMSFNQESFRVSPAHHRDIRIPEELEKKDIDELSEKFDWLRKKYVELIQRGYPTEQVRNILPMGTCTNITMSTNLKQLIVYLKARTLDIAQDEHTYIALLIAAELATEAPKFYEAFVKSEKLEEMMRQYGVLV